MRVADVDKLVDGEKASSDAKGRLVELLAERDARIAQLEAEVRRLGGAVPATNPGKAAGPVVLKAARGRGEGELGERLRAVAERDPDPSRRLAARAALDEAGRPEGGGAEYQRHLRAVALHDPDPERRLHAWTALEKISTGGGA